MAPFGKLYSFADNSRTVGIRVVAAENKIDLDLVETRPDNGLSDDYRKLNKLGRIPTFQGADGYVLTESIAIAVYLASQNEKTSLLGKTKQDYASILRWMSFSNAEVLVPGGSWFRPLAGLDPNFNKKNVQDAEEKTNASFKVLEDHLMINTYLVGERVTLADYYCAGQYTRLFQFVLDKEWRKDHPSVTRWYETIINQPTYKSVLPDPKFAETALKQPPPKPKQEKQEKPEKKKEEPKPKAAAKEADDEEDEPAAPKPAKHPLEALGKSGMPIDDWKRKYKNSKDTRGDAMPWFWQNVDFNEFSIWSVDFKYNEELTMTFMSANQVGGFFNRLEASRKFLFGVANVYGVTNDSFIKGAFLVRGQDYLPAFDVAPDFESYEFKKLDPKNNDDKELVEIVFEQEHGLEHNGKKYDCADGKVFV